MGRELVTVNEHMDVVAGVDRDDETSVSVEGRGVCACC